MWYRAVKQGQTAGSKSEYKCAGLALEWVAVVNPRRALGISTAPVLRLPRSALSPAKQNQERVSGGLDVVSHLE